MIIFFEKETPLIIPNSNKKVKGRDNEFRKCVSPMAMILTKIAFVIKLENILTNKWQETAQN